MHPICFHLGSRPIYWYGVMTALGFLAAVVHWGRRSRLDGYPPGFGTDRGFWIMVSGILGARAAYILANLGDYRTEPWTIFRIDQGGLIYYGGFFGAALAVVLYARLKKRPLWAVGDLAVSPLPLGHALGRIGCLLNGCCFGTESNLPWSIHLQDAHRHPTQVYETVFNVLLYVFILWYYPRRKKDGAVVALYLVSYPLVRFLIEFIRGDTRMGVLGLTMAQAISLVMLAAGVLLWVALPAGRSTPIGERRPDGA